MTATATDRLSRHERALLLGLSTEARLTSNENDLDELDERDEVLAKAINRLTWAVGSGLFTIVCVLLAAVLSK